MRFIEPQIRFLDKTVSLRSALGSVSACSNQTIGKDIKNKPGPTGTDSYR